MEKPMPVPLKERYFEDYIPGERHELGNYAVTESEIVSYARKYDAQSFHIDPDAARQSIYGGLIASGWHTGSIMMNLLAEHFISPRSSMGSPGVDEVRWPRPVRPGDVLRLRVLVIDARRSVSKPDRGLVRLRQECVNQRGEVVMSLTAMMFCRCRQQAPGSTTRPAP
jgi:acyl dehydratase